MQQNDPVSWRRLLIGPWPFVPVALFLLGSLAYLNRSVIVAGVSAEGQGEFSRILGVLALQGIVLAALAVTPIVLLTGWREALTFRYRSDRVPTQARYLTGVTLAAMIAGLVQFSYRYVAIDDVTGRGVFESIPLSLATNFGLTLVFALVASNVTGYAAYRIGLQTRQLEGQVHQLEDQRRQIVEADQRVRSEVAEALHDDVQGALLRATLRLSRTAETVDSAEQAAAMREVIADLEQLRGAGVRAISRRLAPPLSSVGLDGALEELAATYRGTIDIEILLPPDVLRRIADPDDDRMLALYRVVEQALLNATGHGRAAHAQVVLGCTDAVCTLEVTDDGVGLAPERHLGRGSAIIDAWVGIAGGQWTLSSGPERGALLRVEVPLGDGDGRGGRHRRNRS